MINKNILKIRKQLDKLDDHLLNLIKKRTFLVNKILENKKFKKDIIDKITHKIWSSMIRAYIDYEFRKLKK